MSESVRSELDSFVGSDRELLEAREGASERASFK